MSTHSLGYSSSGSHAQYSLIAESQQPISIAFFEEGKKIPSAFLPMEQEDLVFRCSWKIDQYPSRYALYKDKSPLSDPYAKALYSSPKWGGPRIVTPLAPCASPPPFDWEGVNKPNLPIHTLVIYEMHVRGFTSHPSSGVLHPGTFFGVIEQIPHLKKLGINAVELLPIFEFDET